LNGESVMDGAEEQVNSKPELLSLPPKHSRHLQCLALRF